MFYFKNFFLFWILCTSTFFCASDKKATITSSERQLILDSFPKTRETVRQRLNSEEWHLNPEFLSACMLLHVNLDGREKTIKLFPLDFVPDIKTTHEHWIETNITYAEIEKDPIMSPFDFFIHFFYGCKTK